MTQELKREEIIGKRLERSFALDVREMNVDEEARTVELSFSSNSPVYHWFGYLKLDHAKSSVRLERLKETGALLWAHDSRQQIGAVGAVELDSKEGKCRATVKFSDSVCGDENFRDVKNGIKRNVSFGFLIYDLEPEVGNDGEQMRTDDGELVYISRDWEPYEISLVSIPADITVGVGRSSEKASNRSENQKPTEKTQMSKENETPAATPSEQERTVPNPETQRIAEFVEIGTTFGEVELARDMALEEGKTLADLKRAILEKRRAAQVTVPPASPESIANRQNGGNQTELARIISRYSTPRNFKGERAVERAYRFGQWFLAGPLEMESARDFCKTNGIALKRGQVESVNEKGGFLVPDEFGNDLIDLREQYGVFRRNAKIIPMASETRTDPRRTGGLTAYFDGESQEGTQSEKLWDRVGLTAKKLKVMARISSEINEDSVVSMADDLMGEMAYAFAEKEDRCGFIGDGSKTYGGIVGVTTKLKGLSGTIANIAGLQVGSGNAYSELTLTDFEAVVGLLPQYADTPMAKWYVHRSFYYNVMVKLLLAAGGVTAAEIEGQRTKSFLGYAVEWSQVLPKTEANSQVCAILGDLSKAARLGARRDTTIAVSEHSRFSEDEIELKGTERFDINVHDVGNATATAADKVPGPVVGLITAAS